MLGKAEVQAQPRDYMAMRLKLEKYGNWPWTRTTTQQKTADIKVLALQHLWMCHDAYKAAEAEGFGEVTLIIVTPDKALRLYGKDASRGLPAMRLMKQKKAIALTMDEIQWCPRRDL
ncbi:MAG: hypothetical protein ACKPKO_13215, partial [Candidatus Fonsibacter sp.]